MGLSGAASFLVEETANTPNAVSRNQVDRSPWCGSCDVDVSWMQNAAFWSAKISTFAERISSLRLGCVEGGCWSCGPSLGTPVLWQVDVSESANSVVAPIACPQAGKGCLWVGAMVMLQKTYSLGTFGCRLALRLGVATWQKVAVSAWWPKWQDHASIKNPQTRESVGRFFSKAPPKRQTFFSQSANAFALWQIPPTNCSPTAWS